ncbi:hypothetical protein CEXT_547881 [Caerostris extrusa]|uniref:Uncharacterized protein n=1 Tax=Caerostris extrusa TaxID=172846 RepID=A0AAV4NX68_CAEEX|nr:hypothetical protein CEXT_547881 [Caerostris extrusa]
MGRTKNTRQWHFGGVTTTAPKTFGNTDLSPSLSITERSAAKSPPKRPLKHCAQTSNRLRVLPSFIHFGHKIPRTRTVDK